MLLEWGRLVNACQHVDTTITFGPGITALVGANGTGKSNFVGLIRCSATNEFSSLGDVKEANIRRGAELDEPAYIESCWTTAAGEVILRRALANTVSRISVNGIELTELTGKEVAITKKFFELIDTQKEVFDNFMFADYASLQKIIDGTKSERAKLFTSLCGVGIIAKFDEQVRMKLAAAQAICDEFDPADLDSELQQWRLKKAAVKAIREELGQIAKALYCDEDYKAAIQYRDELKSLVDMLIETKTNHALMFDRIRKQKAALTEAQDKLDRAKVLHALAVKSKELARVVTTSLRETIETCDKYAAAARDVAAAKKTLKENDPSKPEFAGDASAEAQRLLIEEKANVVVRGKHIAAELDLIAKSGKGKCETCGSPIDVSPERQSELSTQKLDLQKRYREITATLESIDQYNQALKVYEKQTQALANRKAAARATIKSLQADADKYRDSVEVDEQRILLSRRQRQLKLYTTIAQTAQTDIETQQEVVTTKKTKIETDTETLAELKETLDGYEMPTDAKIHEASTVVLTQDELRQTQRNLKFKLSADRLAAAECAQRIRKLRERQRRIGRLRESVEVMTRARSVCSRNRLPARIVNGMLHLTTDQVNELLRKLSVKFHVVVDTNEYSFIAVHSDKTREPAKRLSTGQGLCLGIAFWLARSAIFAGRLPLFCLDEPTAHIDAAKLVDIADLFAKLSDELLHANRQGIVITHHDAVARSATRCFDLQQGTMRHASDSSL